MSKSVRKDVSIAAAHSNYQLINMIPSLCFSLVYSFRTQINCGLPETKAFQLLLLWPLSPDVYGYRRRRKFRGWQLTRHIIATITPFRISLNHQMRAYGSCAHDKVRYSHRY